MGTLLSVVVAKAGTGNPSTAPSWVAYASLGIAVTSVCIALFLGASTRRTARRALKLTERQEARRENRVDLYPESATSWRRLESRDRLLGVGLLVSNPTDRATSIVGAELHVTYSVGGVLTTVKVPSVAPGEPVLPAAVSATTLPARLEPNDALSCLFLFRISDGLVEDAQVERYDVYLRDLHGIEESLQINLFHEA